MAPGGGNFGYHRDLTGNTRSASFEPDTTEPVAGVVGARRAFTRRVGGGWDCTVDRPGGISAHQSVGGGGDGGAAMQTQFLQVAAS